MTDSRRFESAVLPCLDAAYNLARWLLRDDAAAEDAVQEAVLRAMRYFGSLRGDDARAWFLGIVRNTCFTQLKARHRHQEQNGWDDDAIDALLFGTGSEAADPASDPGLAIDSQRERARVDAAIRALEPLWREVIVLREIEGLDYAEIAQVAAIPLGTVMSRLSRARGRLRELLAPSGIRD